MTDQYALFGHPVKHSLSPIIHQTFAKETGQAISFALIEAPLDGFTQAVQTFITNGGRGFNITLPFKQAAYQLADQANGRAEAVCAANTIRVEQDGRLYADNTDGIGLLRDLERNGCAVAGGDLLIIGAGGAVRGLLPILHAQKPRTIHIANRTLAKAKSIVNDYQAQANDTIKVSALDDIKPAQWTGLINATSASLTGALPDLPDAIQIDAWAYDLVYAKQPTPFMRWAETHGAKTVLEGSGMLVAQAAESFYLWRGVRPSLEPALAALAEH